MRSRSFAPLAVGRRHQLLFAALHPLAQLDQPRHPGFGRLRQHLRFLLRHVVLYVVLQYVELRLEARVLRVQLYHLVQKLLYQAVLLLSMADGLSLTLPLNGRVKDLLLKDRMDVQLYVDVVEDGLLRLGVRRFLEVSEQRLHPAMVVANHLNSIHLGSVLPFLKIVGTLVVCAWQGCRTVNPHRCRVSQVHKTDR